MFKKRLGFALCILFMFFGSTNFCYAQQSAPASKDADLAVRQLENVRIKAQSIGSLFSRLSLSYDIPIGVAIALNDDEFAVYYIDFKKGTLSDLLTQFVTQYDQYAWKITDGVVNVFPKGSSRDVILDELLETKISSLSVKEKTSCWTLTQSLASTPEIRRILELYGITYSAGDISGFYIQQLGQHFTLDVANMTLKSILNKVVKESPVAKIWLIKRYNNNQTFSIRLSARPEDSPMINGKSISPQRDDQ